MQSNLQLLREKYHKGVGQIPHLWRGLRLVWDSAPGWTAVWLLLLGLQGVLPAAQVYLTRYVVDSMVVMIQNPENLANLPPVLVGVALMALVLIVKELLRSLASLSRTTLSEQSRDYLSHLIHQKSMEIDLAYYDSPRYYDLLYRARTGATYRSMALLESLGVLLQNGITLVAMLLVLLPYAWWMPIALLISTLPAFFIVLQHRLRLHRWTVKNTPDERRAWYYDWLLTSRDTAAELRLFQLSDHFQEAFQSLRRRLRLERIQLMRAQSRAELAAGSLALVVTGLSMIWMIGQALRGLVTLGDLALFYSAFNQGQGLMRFFMENVGEMYSHSFFLGDMFEFLALQPRVTDPAEPVAVPQNLREGICFDHITFRYPESSRKTLQDFSLSIAAGQIAAVVGANGAGKSTLVKLLCRFYDPQEGAITLDGVNLRDFSIEDLRRQITVLFQEPVHYSATVRQNIALGDMQADPSLERIIAAAQAAGADKSISYLADGYDTLLGKWFEGGADLSVGEWQRMALARAFLRLAPVIVLDEPTSAMDPWAEADWLTRFRQLAAGHTALLITHRFTTAAFADCIHVMDEGRIVESGNHHELLSGGGRYAASWKEQMQRWMSAS